ncbi:MAG: hypothetical protein ACKVX7_13790 [Planctomycetota bacterium]
MEHHRISIISALVCSAAITFAVDAPTSAATGADVQARITKDVAAGRPIVVHVVVALCDNANQGIVRVPAALGNGQDPRSNLYWGALYGLRTFFLKNDWALVSASPAEEPRVLDRVVLRRDVKRGDKTVPVFVVAEAWDGAAIKIAIERFLEMAAGGGKSVLRVKHDATEFDLAVGGAAHAVAYVGHDGLMEFSVVSPRRQSSKDAPLSALVLACTSKTYFAEHLEAAGAHALLLTTGLMAPEAYTLDVAIRSWAAGESSANTQESAAKAYDRFQKCGLRAARGLFWGAL